MIHKTGWKGFPEVAEFECYNCGGWFFASLKEPYPEYCPYCGKKGGKKPHKKPIKAKKKGEK